MLQKGYKILPFFLALAIAVPIASKPKKTSKETPAAQQVENSEKKQENTAEPQDESAEKKIEPEPNDEMTAYRAIQARPIVTVQDLVDIIMMIRGDFAKHPDATKRIALARQEDWLKDENPNHELDRGLLAYAIAKSYGVEKGWLFWITNWHRYALRDVQEAGIIPSRYTEENKVSGEQLIGAINSAEDYKSTKEQWSANH